MSGVIQNVIAILTKMGYRVLEYATILYLWKMKILKTQMKRVAVSKSQKNLSKAYSGLGSVVYVKLKEGQPSLTSDPAVMTQMRNVEEAEAGMKKIDEELRGICDEFEAKKQAVREMYAAKRSRVGSGGE
ncbi:MAG: hypothetical protein ACUVSA_04735 [Desulfosoma sp.]|uniref:hypothetical protein n=1 Tax=Desulfosoma sp. TaxID=2603217 RepID=UPI00404A9834